MKHDLHPRDRAAAHLHLAQVAAQKLDIGFELSEIRSISCAQIVDYPNVVSESNQPRCEM
jgi:hypothetical protein